MASIGRMPTSGSRMFRLSASPRARRMRTRVASWATPLASNRSTVGRRQTGGRRQICLGHLAVQPCALGTERKFRLDHPIGQSADNLHSILHD